MASVGSASSSFLVVQNSTLFLSDPALQVALLASEQSILVISNVVFVLISAWLKKFGMRQTVDMSLADKLKYLLLVVRYDKSSKKTLYASFISAFFIITLLAPFLSTLYRSVVKPITLVSEPITLTTFLSPYTTHAPPVFSEDLGQVQSRMNDTFNEDLKFLAREYSATNMTVFKKKSEILPYTLPLALISDNQPVISYGRMLNFSRCSIFPTSTGDVVVSEYKKYQGQIMLYTFARTNANTRDLINLNIGRTQPVATTRSRQTCSTGFESLSLPPVQPFDAAGDKVDMAHWFISDSINSKSVSAEIVQLQARRAKHIQTHDWELVSRYIYEMTGFRPPSTPVYLENNSTVASEATSFVFRDVKTKDGILYLAECTGISFFAVSDVDQTMTVSCVSERFKAVVSSSGIRKYTCPALTPIRGIQQVNFAAIISSSGSLNFKCASGTAAGSIDGSGLAIGVLGSAAVATKINTTTLRDSFSYSLPERETGVVWADVDAAFQVPIYLDSPRALNEDEYKAAVIQFETRKKEFYYRADAFLYVLVIGLVFLVIVVLAVSISTVLPHYNTHLAFALQSTCNVDAAGEGPTTLNLPELSLVSSDDDRYIGIAVQDGILRNSKGAGEFRRIAFKKDLDL